MYEENGICFNGYLCLSRRKWYKHTSNKLLSDLQLHKNYKRKSWIKQISSINQYFVFIYIFFVIYRRSSSAAEDRIIAMVLEYLTTRASVTLCIHLVVLYLQHNFQNTAKKCRKLIVAVFAL